MRQRSKTGAVRLRRSFGSPVYARPASVSLETKFFYCLPSLAPKSSFRQSGDRPYVHGGWNRRFTAAREVSFRSEARAKQGEGRGGWPRPGTVIQPIVR